MVRPKFRTVSAREDCAIDSNSASDFGVMSCSNRRTIADLRSGRLSRVAANDIASISRGECASQIRHRVDIRASAGIKQNAGTRTAFRRLNYACLTLVRKCDAKSDHSEILVVAAVTRFQIKRLVDLNDLRNWNSENISLI